MQYCAATCGCDVPMRHYEALCSTMQCCIGLIVLHLGYGFPDAGNWALHQAICKNLADQGYNSHEIFVRSLTPLPLPGLQILARH
jgi:hypothetical protein